MRVLHRPPLDEQQPVARPRIATTLPPLDLGAPARAVGVLRELRAADPSPAEQIRHAIDMALAPLTALLETPQTDPRYKHRVFLVVDNANERLAKLHTSTTHALDNTWWSVVAPVSSAAAELATLAPFTAKAGC